MNDQIASQQDYLICRAVIGFVTMPLILIVAAGTFVAL